MTGDEVESVKLRRGSPLGTALVVALAVVAVGAVVFLVYYRATDAPEAGGVCARLEQRVASNADGASELLRATLPRGVELPVGQPITFSGEDPQPDTPRMICRVNLGIWGKMLPRDDWVAHVKCVDGAADVEALRACYVALSRVLEALSSSRE